MACSRSWRHQTSPSHTNVGCLSVLLSFSRLTFNQKAELQKAQLFNFEIVLVHNSFLIWNSSSQCLSYHQRHKRQKFEDFEIFNLWHFDMFDFFSLGACFVKLFGCSWLAYLKVFLWFGSVQLVNQHFVSLLSVWKCHLKSLLSAEAWFKPGTAGCLLLSSSEPFVGFLALIMVFDATCPRSLAERLSYLSHHSLLYDWLK